MMLGVIVLAGRAISAEEDWRAWRAPVGGPPEVVIQYHRHDAEELPRVARLVALGRSRFLALADTTFPVPIHVLLTSSRREFAKLTAGILPDWGAACALPEERLIIVALRNAGKPLEEAIPHEVSHVLLDAVATYPVPRWFDEGLAMYLSGEWRISDSFRLARGALGGGFIPLAQVEYVLTFQRDRAWLAYVESFGAVSWLAEVAGREGLGRLIRLLHHMPFDEALVEVTGMATPTFETAWLRRMRTRYALVSLADGVWLWSLLIPGLFFLALVARWWHNRRILRQWREEEGDDDEGPDEPLDEHILDTY